jgi:hypothetical protein
MPASEDVPYDDMSDQNKLRWIKSALDKFSKRDFTVMTALGVSEDYQPFLARVQARCEALMRRYPEGSKENQDARAELKRCTRVWSDVQARRNR